MKEIIAYQCADGTIFTDEKKAAAYDEDLLGQEVDGLLKLAEIPGRYEQYKYALNMLKKENRQSLAEQCRLILKVINNCDNGE